MIMFIDYLKIQTEFALDINNIIFGLLKANICTRNWFILIDIIFIQIVSTTKTLCDQTSSSIESTGYIFELTYQWPFFSIHFGKDILGIEFFI